MKKLILLTSILILSQCGKKNDSDTNADKKTKIGDLIFCTRVSEGTYNGRPAYLFKFDNQLGTDCGNDDGWAYKSNWQLSETDRPCSIGGSTWTIKKLKKTS